jgi:2-oxoisovalerate dehydrogenase E2 component (dihydrolipoyl transacylase)
MAMYKLMTRSLEIPHFLYTQVVDTTALTAVREKFQEKSKTKVTALSIIMKAISQAITQFPSVNAHLSPSDTAPKLILKASHDFGIAVDTEKGLVVPVVRTVHDHSVISLASEIERLGTLSRQQKLKPSDLVGSTLNVSNIGSIGGTVIAPVIAPPMVATVAIGRARPSFQGGSEMVLSWSADHRVLDGATVAKCAEMVGKLLTDAEAMERFLH